VKFLTRHAWGEASIIAGIILALMVAGYYIGGKAPLDMRDRNAIQAENDRRMR
jgi:hypothetical protein